MKSGGLFFTLILSVFLLSSCVSGVPPEEVAGVYYNLGNSYSKQGLQTEAIRAYTKALEYDPGLFSAGYNLARVYIELERYDQADAILDDLLARDPDNTILLETRAWSYNLQGYTVKALEVYEDILEVVPSHENALFNATVFCMEAGETEKAWTYASTLYEYTPDDPEVLMRLGYLERERGNPESAADFLEACSQKDPENVECLVTLGDIYNDLAFYGDAVEVLEKAAELQPDADIDFKRAYILLTAMEDYEKGIEALKKAVEAGFNDFEKIQRLAEYPELYRKDDIIAYLTEKEVYTPPEEPEEPAEDLSGGL